MCVCVNSPVLMLRSHVDAVPISSVALFLGNILLSDTAAQLGSHHTSVTLFQHCAHLHLWPFLFFMAACILLKMISLLSGSSCSSSFVVWVHAGWQCAFLYRLWCYFYSMASLHTLSVLTADTLSIIHTHTPTHTGHKVRMIKQRL